MIYYKVHVNELPVICTFKVIRGKLPCLPQVNQNLFCDIKFSIIDVRKELLYISF